MPVRTHAWALLLERLPLRETLDVLRGYSYPPQACEALCQQHSLTETELTDIIRLHRTTCKASRPRGRPTGSPYRDGFDLLFDIGPLRLALAKTPLDTLLAASTLRRLQMQFELRPLELVRVLNAHAEMMTRL